MSTTTTHSSRPPIPNRPREPIGNRPLPKGIVGIGQTQPRSDLNGRETAPEGTLIVGRDIQVKGQIEDCRALIVEGGVEATLKTNHLEIRKGGSFTGSAQVETAVIAGVFEGSLSVSGRLEISATGRVRGETSYAQIAIEAGGTVVGTLDLAGESQARKTIPNLASAGS